MAWLPHLNLIALLALNTLLLSFHALQNVFPEGWLHLIQVKQLDIEQPVVVLRHDEFDDRLAYPFSYGLFTFDSEILAQLKAMLWNWHFHEVPETG